MSNDHKLLWQQVQILAKDDKVVARARDNLSGLFDAAKSGKFELANQYAADDRRIAQALATALRLEAAQIARVSAAAKGPPTAAGLSPDELYSLDQGFKLGPALWEALWEKHRWVWQEGFRRGPGEAARKRLERALLVTVGRQLEAALWKTLEDSPRWRRHRACIFNGIWDAVVYYLGFIALGNKERAVRLEPLIKLLPRILFFCARNEELNSWLVLAG